MVKDSPRAIFVNHKLENDKSPFAVRYYQHKTLVYFAVLYCTVQHCICSVVQYCTAFTILHYTCIRSFLAKKAEISIEPVCPPPPSRAHKRSRRVKQQFILRGDDTLKVEARTNIINNFGMLSLLLNRICT